MTPFKKLSHQTRVLPGRIRYRRFPFLFVTLQERIDEKVNISRHLCLLLRVCLSVCSKIHESCETEVQPQIKVVIVQLLYHAHMTSNQSGAENDKRVLVREQRVLLLSKNKKALFHLSQSGAEFRIQFSPLPKELVKLKSWAVYHTPLWTRVVILSRCKIVIRWQLNSREGRRALSTG